MTTSPTAAIVDGVDGSLRSMHAVDWATREAVARRCPLRVPVAAAERTGRTAGRRSTRRWTVEGREGILAAADRLAH